MQDLGRADFGLFRNLLGRLREYSPEEKNDPGEVVGFQELLPPVSKIVCSNRWQKKQKGQEHWQKLNCKKEACMRWEQGEAAWEDYTDPAQTNMHGPKKDCIYY